MNAISFDLQETRIIKFAKPIENNCVRCLIKVGFSFCNEFVSIPNKQEAIVSSVNS
jgi:hypothetical protein